MTELKSVPQVPGEWLLGNARALRANPFVAFRDWQRNYGDLVGFKVGRQQFYLISHPHWFEHALTRQTDAFVKMYDPAKPTGIALVLGQGLVTSNGELWQKQRRLMQPVFQRKNLAGLLPQFEYTAEQLVQRWQQLGSDQVIDLYPEMQRVTLEIITQTMFGTSVLDRIEQIAPALDQVLRYAADSVINPLLPPLWLPTPRNRRYKTSLALLDEVILGLIQQRRQTPQTQQDTDLLDMLLNARDPDTQQPMPPQQLRDEVVTIFSAGHETTATLLTWTLYLLARHPQVLQTLREELADMPDTGYQIHDLHAQNYCKAVLQETLRFRPSVGALMRGVAHDTALGHYRLQGNSLAIFNLYNIHHHPDFWEQPEQFRPERFLTPARRDAFAPFGAGERICIGNHFSILESQVVLNKIINRFDICLQREEEAEIDLSVSLKPRHGVPVTIRQRH